MHSRQAVAIYDRFGRLLYGQHPVRDGHANGAEATAGDAETPVQRDVLEYLVFEKHLVDPLAPWRLHTKLVPDWFRRTSPQNPLPAQRTQVSREAEPLPKARAQS